MAKKTVNVENMVTVRGTVKLVNEYQELVLLQKQLKDKAEVLKKEIMRLMTEAGVTEAKAGNYKVTIGVRHNSGTVDKDKLKANYPEAYADCYKDPTNPTTPQFTVKAFTVPRGESTAKMLADIIAAIDVNCEPVEA